MSEHYIFYCDNQRIGSSALEHGDPYMGIRMGRFYPKAGYGALKPLYTELSSLSFEEGQASGDRERQQILKGRLEQLERQAAILHWGVQTPEGEVILTAWIHIEDFSADLGEEGVEITLHVDDYLIYAKYFGSGDL